MDPMTVIFLMMGILGFLLLMIYLFFWFLSKRNCIPGGESKVLFSATCGARIGMTALTFPFCHVKVSEDTLELHMNHVRQINFTQIRKLELKSMFGLNYLQIICILNGKLSKIQIGACNCIQLALILNEKTKTGKLG
ncbi:MAG: hypothetical protein GXO69_06835 [Acidobacteria bacterium]|nr:hypothetical protein [Acidobacteriota bacterium]